MQNWPDVEPCAAERLMLRLVRATGTLSSQFKAAEEELARPSKAHEEFAQPRGVTVHPFKVIFVDLFFKDDLAPLKAGLRAIHSALGTGGSTRHPSETLERLVAKGMPGAWASLFTFKLPGTGESVTVHLHTLSPSTACVAFEATPSEALVKSFASIVSQAPPRDSSLWRVRRRTRGDPGWYLEAPSPLLVRKRQIEKTFLALNRALVGTVRRHVGAGGSLLGPLPSIEAFLVETNDLPRPITDGDMETFWQSVEMPQRPGALYRHEAVTAYAPLWTAEENLYFRCRATVDAASVAQRDAAEGTQEEAAAMRLSMSAGWYELQVIFAILHQLDLLRKELDFLEGAFAGSHPRDHLPRLNRAQLHHGRVAALFDDRGELKLGPSGTSAEAAKTTPREDWMHAASRWFRDSRRRLETLRDIVSSSR
jgi:hypothetical protein